MRETVYARAAKSISISYLGIVLLLLGSGVCPAKSEFQKSGFGELKLEGKYIERLVLSRNDGYREVLNGPGDRVRLPAGQYLVRDVRLKGGFGSMSACLAGRRMTGLHAHALM